MIPSSVESALCEVQNGQQQPLYTSGVGELRNPFHVYNTTEFRGVIAVP